MSSFKWCIPDPNQPDQQLCEDIPVLIERVHEILDGAQLPGEVAEAHRTDVAVLVALDQIAGQVKDQDLRAYLYSAVDTAVAGFNLKVPGGLTLKRTG